MRPKGEWYEKGCRINQGSHHIWSVDFVLIAKGKYFEVLRQARMGSDVFFCFLKFYGSCMENGLQRKSQKWEMNYWVVPVEDNGVQ